MERNLIESRPGDLSPAHGRALSSSADAATWLDAKTVEPERLLLAFGPPDRKVTCQVRAPVRNDPHWSFKVESTSEPRITAIVRGRSASREEAVRSAEAIALAVVDPMSRRFDLCAQLVGAVRAQLESLARDPQMAEVVAALKALDDELEDDE